MSTLKGRLKYGYFLVEGHRAIDQINKNYPHYIEEIIIAESNTQTYTYDPKIPIRILSLRQYATISDQKNSPGISAIVSLPEGCYSDKLPQYPGSRILLLENIQDPGNVGTLIRTAVAFNFSGVLLSSHCADPFSPKTVQATAGSNLALWMRKSGQFYELVGSLRKSGFTLVAADLSGKEKPGYFKNKKIALALGNEGTGFSSRLRSMTDLVFTITHHSKTIESLNVAAAGAICMYLVRNQNSS